MDVLSLVAKLTLDSSEYDRGLSGAGERAQSTFGSKLATAAKVGGAAIAAVGAAATAVTAAVSKGVAETAAYGDNIDKMSQKLGMSAEAYQEWDAIMQHAGTSIDSMQSSMKTLASAAETGKDSFDKLGISQEQIAAMSQEELFSATISALQNVSDETERTYLAGQLLGRGATELGPLLNMTAEETEELRQRVHEIGGVMSDDAVKAAAAYQDSLQDLQTSFGGLKRNLLSEFLPSVTTVMDGLTELFSGGDGIEKISTGIKTFVDNLSKMLPKVMQTGTKIIMSLGDAIVSNLPVITEAATQTILTLFTGFVDNLPMIVSAGLQMLLTLANGIADSLPVLIPTIVDVILQIVDILTKPETLGALVDASIAIIIALADGLIEALPRLIQAVPTIITNLVTAIIQNAPKLVEAGFQLVNNLASGILQAVPNVLSAATQMTDDIKATVVDGLSDLWDRVKPVFEKFGNAIKTTVNTDLENMKNAYEENGGGLQGITAATMEGLRSKWTFAFDVINNYTEGKLDWIKQALSDTMLNLVSSASIGLNNIVGRLDNFWSNVTSTVQSLVNSALTWGRDLIQNFINGITQRFQSLRSTLSSFAGTVRSFIGFSEPEEGPLSNFHTYAPDMMKLFAEGIRKNEHLVTDQLARSFDFGAQLMPGLPAGYSGQTFSVPVMQESRDMTIVLTLDGQEFGRAVYKYGSEESQRVGVRLAGGVA